METGIAEGLVSFGHLHVALMGSVCYKADIEQHYLDSCLTLLEGRRLRCAHCARRLLAGVTKEAWQKLQVPTCLHMMCRESIGNTARMWPTRRRTMRDRGDQCKVQNRFCLNFLNPLMIWCLNPALASEQDTGV